MMECSHLVCRNWKRTSYPVNSQPCIILLLSLKQVVAYGRCFSVREIPIYTYSNLAALEKIKFEFMINMTLSSYYYVPYLKYHKLICFFRKQS